MRSNSIAYAFPVGLAVLFVGLSTTSAHAYLDAGTGSMILQLLLGGVAGLAIAGKLYWYKFLALFGVKAKHSETPAEDVAKPEVRADQ
jgi:hypothetical protein